MTARCATCGGTMYQTGGRDPMTRLDEAPRCMLCGRTNEAQPTLESLQIVPRAVAHHNRARPASEKEDIDMTERTHLGTAD